LGGKRGAGGKSILPRGGVPAKGRIPGVFLQGVPQDSWGGGGGGGGIGVQPPPGKLGGGRVFGWFWPVCDFWGGSRQKQERGGGAFPFVGGPRVGGVGAGGRNGLDQHRLGGRPPRGLSGGGGGGPMGGGGKKRGNRRKGDKTRFAGLWGRGGIGVRGGGPPGGNPRWGQKFRLQPKGGGRQGGPGEIRFS